MKKENLTEYIQVYISKHQDSQGHFEKIPCDTKDDIDVTLLNTSFTLKRIDEYECFSLTFENKVFHLLRNDPFVLIKKNGDRLSFTYFKQNRFVAKKSITDYAGVSLAFNFLVMIFFANISLESMNQSTQKIEPPKKEQNVRVENLLKKLEVKKIVEKPPVPKPEEKKVVEVPPKVEPKPEPKKLPDPPKPKVAEKPPGPGKPSKEAAPKIAGPKKPTTSPKPGPENLVKNNSPKPASAPSGLAVSPAPGASTAGSEQAKKQIANTLSFLGKGPSKAGLAATQGTGYSNSVPVFSGGPVAKGSGDYLNKVNSRSVAALEGPIVTEGSRRFGGSAVGPSDVSNKDFNNVVGKVDARSLYNAGSGGSGTGGGGGYFGGGAAFKTSGNIDSSEIKKILSQHMSKFTYCYEKALLTSPNLAGEVVLTWVISSSGRVSSSSVSKSALNSASLHSCLLATLGTIGFPSPKGGGSADVSYPFKFSNNSL